MTAERVLATALWRSPRGERRIAVVAGPLGAEDRARHVDRYPDGEVVMIRLLQGAGDWTYAGEGFGTLEEAKAWAEARWPGLAWTG